MSWTDFLPFVPDRRTYFVPWIRFRSDQGEAAEGPMIRQGKGRREILAWLVKAPAETAARALILQTGGKFEIRTMNRRDLQAQAREYSSWGSRVVAVIMK